MPSESGYVGGLQLPVPAGTLKQYFGDPAVDALLDFAAYYIKWALDAKLAQLTGTSSDAVPVANRFSFDPLEARGHVKKLPHPALFVYWDGKSTAEQQTIFYKVRQRTVSFMYVFDELPHFDEMQRRAGLFNAVDAAMHQMTVRQVHQSYGYGTSPDGMWLNSSIATQNFLSWEWLGSTPGRFGIDEGPRAERRAAKRSGRDWPALKGAWKVEERVGLRTLEDPTDLLTDTPMTIYGSDGESAETTEIMERILPAPDGSEQLDDE